jgi:hypothetical protein
MAMTFKAVEHLLGLATELNLHPLKRELETLIYYKDHLLGESTLKVGDTVTFTHDKKIGSLLVTTGHELIVRDIHFVNGYIYEVAGDVAGQSHVFPAVPRKNLRFIRAEGSIKYALKTNKND